MPCDVTKNGRLGELLSAFDDLAAGAGVFLQALGDLASRLGQLLDTELALSDAPPSDVCRQ